MWSRLLAAVALFCLVGAQSGAAQQPLNRPTLLRQLCGEAPEVLAGAQSTAELAATAGQADLDWMQTVLFALVDRRLSCGDDAVTLTLPAGTIVNATTLAPATGSASGRTPILNLRSRGVVEPILAALNLLVSRDANVKIEALRAVEKKPQPALLAIVERALKTERDPQVKDAIQSATETLALRSPDPEKQKIAIRRLSEEPSTRSLTLLLNLRSEPAYTANAGYKATLDGAISSIERWLAFSNVLATIYNGMSLASILFMAAVGLAIIFGLMGVINLAQGEFLMIGAYVTFLVQEAFRAVLPGLLDWYLIAAIPIVFAVTATIGMALESSLIRHFYSRPLMSLLATWAVSLFLVNLVRVAFGTQNLQFVVPFYLKGGITVVGDFIITWNRLFAIGFALLTLGGTYYILRRTTLGLNMRAVTLNRTMAGCIGVKTRQIDRLAFALGSGLAGLAGLALCPIYNVNPQMGTLFIIDSFMIVVLGGVGTLVGTLVAAIGVGQINVLIEPAYGAVAAKVIVLLMIILFLQWRPEGLFAVKGRRK